MLPNGPIDVSICFAHGSTMNISIYMLASVSTCCSQVHQDDVPQATPPTPPTPPEATAEPAMEVPLEKKSGLGSDFYKENQNIIYKVIKLIYIYIGLDQYICF